MENKQILDLILENQRQTREEVTEIKRSLITMVRLDEKLVNQQDGLQRFGGRLDNIDKLMGSALDRLQTLETMEKAKTQLGVWLSGIVSSVLTAVIVLWITKG